MSNYLVKRLEPWVTAFSASLPMRFKHGDQVVIGGEIKSVFDLRKFLGNEDECGEDEHGNKLKIEPRMVEIIVDDAVGIIKLILLNKIYDELSTKHDFKPGMIILAEGKVFDEKKDRSRFDDEYEHAVACWKVWPLPEDDK